MRKNVVAIIAVLVLVIWGTYDYTTKNSKQAETMNQQQNKADAEVGIKKGNKAPDFELLHLSGSPVKLSDFLGKKLILNFWATWCPPCRAEMPHMEKFYKDNEKDVVVLAVNLTNTEKKRSDVTAFVEDFALTFPIVMDAEGNKASMYQIFAYPTSYMIDSEGIIQEIFQGAINYDMMKKTMSKIN
ncbi:TlpA family protein disulfide reductase [Paenibacillus nasutitermitis]|uniref:Thiol:disulfide interchange protein tlpA n=1 Tax=Paenibacillus nasutitermitis TaxID=1652958 RepID=A0A916ZAD5_9BACL|nr:TlpA disulfide reductase family protein [Paenibacillus nasutitermitis]GGD83751.1 thiol:disulfide interchange protein tlpA [Paenibacillus nasutitermitis]